MGGTSLIMISLLFHSTKCFEFMKDRIINHHQLCPRSKCTMFILDKKIIFWVGFILFVCNLSPSSK